jgi:hypothetical protein
VILSVIDGEAGVHTPSEMRCSARSTVAPPARPDVDRVLST